MLVTGFNALQVEAKDVMEEVIAIHDTCESICELRLTTVSNIHACERLCRRIRELVEKDYFYRRKIRDLIKIKGKGNFLYLHLNGTSTHIKIQEKYSTITSRPWWLTVSPIVNKGDRTFRG